MVDGITTGGIAEGRRRNPIQALRRLVEVLWHYRCRCRERAQLLAMGERERRDIGISRYDALREAGKPFWR